MRWQQKIRPPALLKARRRTRAMMRSAREILRLIRARLHADSSLDARWLLAIALGRDEAVLGHEMIELTTAQQAALDQLIEQRNQGRPISRMRGRREFYSLTYYLNDHTLDPRPDSECLIDEALAYARSLSAERRPLRCLDLGTGTGCLLLSLLYHLPAATGLGVDLAPQAVAQARANAASLGLSGRTRFICSHWLDKVAGDFDLILANPPYIESADQTLARDVADHDPARALFAGPDGLDAYRELLPQITDVLRPMGRLFLEIGSQQARPVTQLATAAGLQLCALIADLSGRDRCLILCKK